MTQLHEFLSEHTLWDGLKKEDENIIDYFLKEPVWEMPESKEYLTQGKHTGESIMFYKIRKIH